MPELLALVLDLDNWNNVPLTLSEFLDSFLVFCNMFGTISDSNRLLVFAILNGKGQLVYDGLDELGPNRIVQTQTLPRFSWLEQGLRDFILTAASQPKLSVVSALSLSLAKAQKLSQEIQTRIMVLGPSKDVPGHYMEMMNVAFCARKMRIHIDSCRIGTDSMFCQQAAYISGGLYKVAKTRDQLVQALFGHYLVEAESRSWIKDPPEPCVAFYTHCFCHKKRISVGYVCSICLSVFCAFTPVCTICKTKFSFPSK